MRGVGLSMVLATSFTTINLKNLSCANQNLHLVYLFEQSVPVGMPGPMLENCACPGLSNTSGKRIINNKFIVQHDMFYSPF